MGPITDSPLTDGHREIQFPHCQSTPNLALPSETSVGGYFYTTPVVAVNFTVNFRPESIATATTPKKEKKTKKDLLHTCLFEHCTSLQADNLYRDPQHTCYR